MRTLGNHLASALAALCAVILLNSCAQPRPKAVTSLPKPSPAPAPQPHVARVPEIRGVWVSDTTKLDWDSATANLQRAGFNTIYANSRRVARSFTRTARRCRVSCVVRLIRSRVASNWRTNAGWRCMPNRLSRSCTKRLPRFNTNCSRRNRVMRGPDGHPVLQSGNTWLCPSVPANRALIENSVTEMVRAILSRYAVALPRRIANILI